MSWHTYKREPADDYYSKYLRLKVGKCEYDEDLQHSSKLEVSHFWGRRHRNTRFSDVNCDCLCKRHHKYFHEHRTEYEAWKLKKLGQERYDLLMFQHNQRKDKDLKMELYIAKELYSQELMKQGN